MMIRVMLMIGVMLIIGVDEDDWDDNPAAN